MSGCAITPSPLDFPWNLIFQQGCTWLAELEHLHDINPEIRLSIVGAGLHALHRKKNTKTYLVLLLNDWTGDLRYAAGALHESFKSFKYISAYEIVITGSEMTLNIAECLGVSKQRFELPDPSKLFKSGNRQLGTSIVYYGDSRICDISPCDIGGIEDETTSDICSLKMASGNHGIIYRILIRSGFKLKLRDIMTEDENGKQSVTHWRRIGSSWIE